MSYFDFTYDQPTRLVFGTEATRQVAQQLELCGARKVMLTMGGGSVRRSGLLQQLTDAMDGAGVAWCLYEGCRANPEASWVNEGARTYARQECDFILAVGGGSVIDASKAISLLATNEGDDIWPYMTYEKNFQQPAAPLGVVLTIAATGSECDASFVISNGESQEKLLFTENSCIPRFALCDPAQTYTVSPWQTACGVSDMLSHLLEQYLYTESGCTVSDEMLLGVMRAVVQWGPVAVTAPENYDARANLMLASTLAMNGLLGVGHDQNWAAHMMEHGASAIWPELAHGAGMACLMPAYMEHIGPVGGEKLTRLAAVFGCEDAAAGLRNFLQGMGLPTTLTGLIGRAPTEQELQMIVERSFPWGPMEAGGYPAFAAEDAMALLQKAI